MHSCLEGVAAQFTKYFLEQKSDDEIAVIDNIIKNIAVPQQVQRLCRPISSRKDWKVREWENFILYYSIPIFSSILTKAQLLHWIFFVQSLYIILGEKIHTLNKADEMLHFFVYKAFDLYGITAMSFNLHLCLHLCECVLNWGPLWTNSTFCFESANYNVLRAI